MSGWVIFVVVMVMVGMFIYIVVVGVLLFDEIWLWVFNVIGLVVMLIIEWGGVMDFGDYMMKGLSIFVNLGLILVVVGKVLNGGFVVCVFFGIVSVLNVIGYVNRIV